jgi:Carboxypeptidase regulatory-like domain/TonB-dependent Receptor Plug Domain/TonB dependent receptor
MRTCSSESKKSVQSFLKLLVALFVLVACATGVGAQTYRGTIHGVVRDQSGGVIIGAAVSVKNLANGESRSTTTTGDGGYVLPELSAGEYDVTVTQTGFNTARERAIVEVGLDTSLDVTLEVGSIDKGPITVTAAAPLVDTERDVLGEVVDNRMVEELPLNGRDFGKLVALVPGVTVEGSGVAGTEKGFGQFNINGNRDRSNNYTLDGTDNNDPWFNNSALNQVGISGAPATLLPIDAIQEFNVQSQFPAEYGRNSGSVVNILTKSGSNQFHGSAFEYNRNSYFDARNFFNVTPDPQTLFINNQFGGSIGGPIIKDRTFFFAAYEGQRERVGSDFVFQVPTQAEIASARNAALLIDPAIVTAPLDAILTLFPQSSTNELPGVVNDVNNNDNLIVKVDHKFTNNESFAARYAFGNDNQTFPFGSLGGEGDGSRLAPFAQISPTRVNVVSASLLSTLGPSHLNELRFGYTRFSNSFTSADAKANLTIPGLDFGSNHAGLPEFDFDGAIENLGATAFSVPRARTSQSFQALDNFTWIHGVHTFKFGGEYRRVAVSAFNDNLERGLIGFAPSNNDTTLDQTITDVLTNFYLGNAECDECFTTANTGNTQRTTYNNGAAFFAQDDYRVRSNLTLNLGLRWEYFGPVSEKDGLLYNFGPGIGPNSLLQHVGSGGISSPYRRDLNNFGPRIGVAWSPLPRTTVRAGYGLYYDYIPQDLMIANFTDVAGIATNPIGPKPVFPMEFNQTAFTGEAPGPVFTVAPPPYEIFIVDPNLRTPYVSSWNLNIEQQAGDHASFQIGYVGSKGTRLTRLHDINQDFTNPNFETIDEFSTGASSTYHALQINGRLRNFHGLSGFYGYVFSKSLDDASDGIDFNFATAAFPQNSDDLRAEKGPSTFDTKHRFTGALNYSVPVWGRLPKRLAEGWALNTIVTIQSGRPIPIIDDEFGINGHLRPDVVPGVNPILPHWTPATGYLNPAAFAEPAGEFGTLGRDQIYGPGFWNADFSATKDTKITETLGVQFRAELFNIFNHPNFALPNNVVTPGFGPDGVISATPDVAQGNPGLGGGGPRVIQFAVRLRF